MRIPYLPTKISSNARTTFHMTTNFLKSTHILYFFLNLSLHIFTKPLVISHCIPPHPKPLTPRTQVINICIPNSHIAVLREQELNQKNLIVSIHVHHVHMYTIEFGNQLVTTPLCYIFGHLPQHILRVLLVFPSNSST